MRMREFWALMDEEFGPAYSSSLSKGLVLAALNDCTVLEAVEQGQNLRAVWHAVCEAMDLPATRRGFEPPRTRQGRELPRPTEGPVPAKFRVPADTNA